MKFLLDHHVPAEIAHRLRYWEHNVTVRCCQSPHPDEEVFGQCLFGKTDPTRHQKLEHCCEQHLVKPEICESHRPKKFQSVRLLSLAAHGDLAAETGPLNSLLCYPLGVLERHGVVYGVAAIPRRGVAWGRGSQLRVSSLCWQRGGFLFPRLPSPAAVVLVNAGEQSSSTEPIGTLCPEPGVDLSTCWTRTTCASFVRCRQLFPEPCLLS